MAALIKEITVQISVETHLHDAMTKMATEYMKEFGVMIGEVTFDWEDPDNPYIVRTDIATMKLVPEPAEDPKWFTITLSSNGGTNVPMQEGSYWVKRGEGAILCQVETYKEDGKWREIGTTNYFKMDGTTYTPAKAPEEK